MTDYSGKRITIILISVSLLGSLFSKSYGQQKLSAQNNKKMGDSLYAAKNYPLAASYYKVLSEQLDYRSQKANNLYNIACCLSLAGEKDSAISWLRQSIKAGYGDSLNLIADPDLTSLHGQPAWAEIVKSIHQLKKVLNTNPGKAKFITDDVHRFWPAYDKAMKDTLHFRSIFKQYYFDRASRGMDDYMNLKVDGIDEFVAHIRSAPKFYAAIRKKTLQVDSDKPTFLNAFYKLKSIYPPAEFPDVYFIIGAFTSGGTISDAGLLIGVNQECQDDNIPLDELSFSQKARMNYWKYLPNIIAHELIHYQQEGLKKDTITLGYVLLEGMADFIGELISGNTANPVLYEWAKGKEKIIWENFKKDMYFNRYHNWMANSTKGTPDNLPDQGYWIGYQICKSYYENAPDKKKAISEMLNIKDYKDFLEKSKWEDKLARMK